jgi:hypothetical protein
MFTDIVFPQGNEDEFLEMAKKLRCNLVFAYEKIPSGIREKYVQAKNLQDKMQAKSPCVGIAGILGKGALKADLILGTPDQVERREVDIVCDLEGEERKDGLHERKTALDHVLCVKAKEKEKILLIDFSLLLHAPNKALVLGRMLQNAQHMRKYKNDVIIASLARDPYDMRAGHDYLALLEELGYDGREGKTAVELLTRLLNEKQQARTH